MRFMPSFIRLREHAEQATSALPDLIIHAEKLADSILHGEHARRKAGAGEKFWQYREYTPGDRPQDIDWRQSAKTDTVFIKQKEWQITRKSYFWCNTSASMDFKSKNITFSKRDYARILTLSLAILLQKNKEQLGLYGQIQTGRSEKMIETIGYALFEQNNQELPKSNSNALPKDAHFIGISDFLSPFEEIETTVNQIAQSTENATLIQILDPAEYDLPYEGRIEFSDNKKQNRNLINHVPTIRADYKKRIEEHCKQVEQLCSQKGWVFIQCITNQSPVESLQNIYMRMDARGETA